MGDILARRTAAPLGAPPERGKGEKGRREYLLEEFLELGEDEFLPEAFRRVLGREPDPASRRFFEQALRARTMSRTEVLGHLRSAPEGRARGLRVRGLTSRFWLARVARRLSPTNGAHGDRSDDLLLAVEPTVDVAVEDPARPFTAEEAATLRRLGLGPSLPLVTSESVSWAAPHVAPEHGEPENRWLHREGVAFATLCTVSHLAAARALLSSVHAHHPEADLYLLLVDGERDVVLPCPATVLLPSDLQVPRFGFLALKYNALDLCCALKPFLLQYLLERTTHEKLLYLDSDIVVFRRLTELLERLDDAAFVVTPHLLAPHHDTWRLWERPSLGDLHNAGIFNAGMFGLRATENGHRFLECLCELVTAPGAFHLSGQAEQHSFNWVVAFCDGVAVLRDTTYNVAYWNLHDRSLRDRRLDEPQSAAAWTVDGRPLAAFHFSGFSPDAPWALSRYDERHSTHVLPSVRSILDHYCELLRQHRDPGESPPYRYGRWRSGWPIDHTMRRIFREHEVLLDRDMDPWSAEGEAYYAGLLMRPMPGSGSLLPILWEEVYRQRPDLQALFPDAGLLPRGMMRWAAALGVHEHGYDELFGAHRLRSPSSRGARRLLTVVCGSGEPPEIPGEVLSRRSFIEWLRKRGEDALADDVARLDIERTETTLVDMVRRLVDEERPDLRSRFPQLLFADAEDMARWLDNEGEPGYLLPQGAAREFRRCAEGRSLARIFSFVNAHWRLGAQFPLAFVGEGRAAFAQMLLRALRTGCQYDVEDVAMYLWVMAERPSAGLGLTFELLPNLGRDPGPWTAAGQEALLGRLLGQPEFVAELEAHRACHPCQPTGPTLPARRKRTITVFELMAKREPDRDLQPPAQVSTSTSGSVARRGVNLFGYFRSPIGLGMLSRGVAAAIEAAGLPVARNLLGNVAMDGDTSPADFVGKFEFELDTNLFCSYPHFDELLLDRLPAAMVEGRRNVVYLAWEQRDGMELWRRVYERFDQVWALSDFAADALSRFLERDVLTVPCVLDFDSFPAAARKSELGLDESRVSFLYVFDANSSVERKNPGAVIEAFTRAFAGSAEAELILKISNASRVENRERLQRLVGRAIQKGTRVRVIARDMSRCDILRLVSAADCYVSLHRAEGFGYTCAEAMAYGKPVIATGYSGNLQFMDDDNSFLVGYREVEVERAEGPFPRGSVWAEPDVEHAARLMRRVAASPEVARRVGHRAAIDVRTGCSVDAVGKLIAGALGVAGAPVRRARQLAGAPDI